jgi:hypothetical protein
MAYVSINKGLRISDKHYTIDMDHESICKLMGLMIRCHNSTEGLTVEDKKYLRDLDDKIMEARQQGTPA